MRSPVCSVISSAISNQRSAFAGVSRSIVITGTCRRADQKRANVSLAEGDHIEIFGS